ncbi:response regulator transcription factor [Thalassotalea sp. M1531]|uniref:Response regulator transcription factor n=1 Tax=Thalassotalea algicola TaxID=2716224 RepID=A0A7Y0L9Z3_9GAMM|nr:response regulator transcription factor [Thalassotalea algicola]NMP30690.1 response regulator transcription factor [Thalassotalea algicola]
MVLNNHNEDFPLKKKILLFNRNLALNNALMPFVQSASWQVNIILLPELISYLLSKQHFDALILGFSSLDTEDLALIAKLRQQFSLPIIAMCDGQDAAKRVDAYKVGSDDVTLLDSCPEEFQLKLQAIWRRSALSQLQKSIAKVLDINDIFLDPAVRRVYCQQQEIILTSKEFNILQLLMQRAGEVVSKVELCNTVLCHKYSPLSRGIDVHISNIRKKIASVCSDDKFKTVRGVGYVFLHNHMALNYPKTLSAS